MKTIRTLTDRLAQGRALEDRFQQHGVHEDVAEVWTEFQAAHQAFERAAQDTDAAGLAQDRALRAVSDTDAHADVVISKLADALVVQGMVKRTEGFGAFSPHSPSRMKELPYKTELEAARALLARLRQEPQAAAIEPSLQAVEQACTAVDDALRALTRAQSNHTAALGARDALFPAWDKALKNLKRRSTAAYDEPVFKALFAAPSAIHRPTSKRAKK